MSNIECSMQNEEVNTEMPYLLYSLPRCLYALLPFYGLVAIFLMLSVNIMYITFNDG